MNARQLLWRIVQYQPWLYAGNIVLEVLRFVLVFAPGLVVQALFDQLSGATPAMWDVWGLSALLVAVALGRVAALLGAITVENRTYFRAAAWLRTNLFARLLNRPDAGTLPLPSGEIVNRLDVDGGALPLYVNGLQFMLGTAGGAVVAVVLMARIDWLITLVVLVPMLASSAGVTLLSARLTALRRASRSAQGDVSGFLGEVFGSVQALQIAAAEDRAVHHLKRLNQARQHAAVRERLLSETLFGVFGSFVDNIAQLALGVVLLLVGQRLRAGTFTVGDFALFVYALPRIGDFALLLSNSVAGYRQANVALERLEPLLAGAPVAALTEHVRTTATPIMTPQPASEVTALLVVRGLTYRYPHTGRGISGIDLQLARGSFTVITGQIGSGKTTLLRVLLGLLPRDDGTITWNGQLVPDPQRFFVPPRTALTPQLPRLFSDTLRENILLGGDATEEQLARALHTAVMEPDVHQLAHGLDTVVGPRGVKLSGGQLQRTAIARMSVREPELLVCDDVSSALDGPTEQLLWERLACRPGRPPTIRAVSHRPAVLRRADYVIVLHDGSIVTQGAPDELTRAGVDLQRWLA